MATRKSVLVVRPATKSQDLRYLVDAVPAYRCDQSRLLNTERALKSTAFLLEWCSDIGNEPLDGPLAFALSRVLGDCATEVAEARAFFMAECMGPVQRAAKSGRR